jgi:hydroxymethylglutaryl-CoA reductase
MFLMKSDISGFHKLSPEEKAERVKQFAGLTEQEMETLRKTGALDFETANRMIENVIGTTEFPLGIATNFLINGRDYLIPMAIEEPSVVAAASYAAKLARPGGGFRTSSTPPVMIGQIQLLGIKDPNLAKQNILLKKQDILDLANTKDPVLVKFGGGAKDLEINILETKRGRMLIVNLLVDVRDVMGANAVNTMAEAISPLLEEITEGEARLRIISNLAVKRLARARAVWNKSAIGPDTVERVLDSYEFAANDQFRCTTHNKGAMNGVDAVTIATGNDFRAIEAGAHSYAARGGSYKPLSKFHKDREGNLVGEIELPVAVGIVGGSIRTNPVARISLKILGVKTASELGEILAATGLAQNFAAMRALSTEGIQRGHMGLHAANIAVQAGAKGEDIERIAKRMIKEKNINVNRAKELLEGRE